jgi:hypothetical protein
MVDHLWPDRALNTSEERRRRKNRYYDDLRAQIAARTSPDRPPAADRTVSRPPAADAGAPERVTPTRTQASQFVDSVLAPVTAARSAAPSALSQSLPPASTWSAPTFSVTPAFDVVAFELPAAPRLISRSRQTAEYNRVRAISLSGAATVKSALEQASWDPPIITGESPMHLSKVPTPAAGFSVRRGFSGQRAPTQPLPAESHLIYPDGHIV